MSSLMFMFGSELFSWDSVSWGDVDKARYASLVRAGV